MTDWESDPRPLRECLAAWAARHGWEAATAAKQLRVSYKVYWSWQNDRSPRLGPMIRRLMTLIDRTAL